jgi:hypothetical protein
MCLIVSDSKLTISIDLWTLTPELQCQEVSYPYPNVIMFDAS